MTANIIANPTEIRTDDLQRFAEEEVVRRRRFGNTVNALLLPAGSGEVAIALGRLDCRVTGVDGPDRESGFRNRLAVAGLGHVATFATGSLTDLPDDLPGEPFDFIFLRRGVCRLPYEQARQVVAKLLLRLKIGGKLYLSILGLHSELGDGYGGDEALLGERFCELEPAMAKKYDIHRPVCLYSERDLFTLLTEAGGSVLRTFTSTHGNVKGVAVRV